MTTSAIQTKLTDQTRVPPVQVDTALISLRSSGHDPSSAVGEVIDNSLEASANNVRLHLFTEKKVVRKGGKRDVVERVATGDDGDGMAPDTLHRALSLGFSTRFNSRKGMGRFGVGAKLGAISQAKRIDMWSRQRPNVPWLWTYIDLDEISAHTLVFLPEPEPRELPDDCKDLVGDVGTLVVWSKCDRLQERDSGGARTADMVKAELVPYIARTFRKFLDAGRRIYVDDKLVKPHDPLFLMTTTRFHEGPDPDPTAEVKVDEGFDWPIPGEPDGRTSRVEVTLTLLPEKFRPERGSGDWPMAKERHIDDDRQEGFSILRANREIFFDFLRGIQLSRDDVDRWIGKEIRFTPELDECFAVRNVKKGAEPINGLRDKLRGLVNATIRDLREKHIRKYWGEQEEKKRAEKGIHAEAEQVAARAATLLPKLLAGREVSQEEKETKLRKAAEILVPPDKKTEEAIQAVKEGIKKLPLKIIPEEFPGNEFIEIDHLGDTVLVRLNTRHAFYKEVYSKLLEAMEKDGDSAAGNSKPSVAKLVQVGIDLLLLAYARAEGMDPNPQDKYSELRTYWGVNLKAMVNEWTKS